MRTISGKDEDIDIVRGNSDSTNSTSSESKNAQDSGSDYHDFQLVIDSGFNCTWIILS